MIDLLKEAMEIKKDGLSLVVLGSSGAGKSHFIGTYPGKTLLIYGAGESHGPASAAKNQPDLIPVAWDRAKDESGAVVNLPPDAMLKRIRELLDPKMLAQAGVKCVALDSLTNLVLDLKKTTIFKQRCSSGRGQHNSFKESEALIELASDVLRSLLELTDFHGIDVITTLDLQLQAVADDGTILESKPGLPTFGVAKALVQMFPDILVLGRVGEKRDPMFQSCAKAAAVSVDRETKTMVKYIEFNPRLRGVDSMPEYIAPDAAKILEMKRTK